MDETEAMKKVLEGIGRGLLHISAAIDKLEEELKLIKEQANEREAGRTGEVI